MKKIILLLILINLSLSSSIFSVSWSSLKHNITEKVTFDCDGNIISYTADEQIDDFINSALYKNQAAEQRLINMFLIKKIQLHEEAEKKFQDWEKTLLSMAKVTNFILGNKQRHIEKPTIKRNYEKIPLHEKAEKKYRRFEKQTQKEFLDIVNQLDPWLLFSPYYETFINHCKEQANKKSENNGEIIDHIIYDDL